MQDIGVIIVDHGSRRAAANRTLEAFVKMFAGQSDYRIIEPAHMELAEPSIATAFDRCIEQGARHVVLAPYFLSPGRHWDQDIPALAAGAGARHKHVTYQVTEPIGLHPLMIEIIRLRIEQCVVNK